MAEQPRSTGAGGLVIGVAAVYVTLLVASYVAHDGAIEVLIGGVLLVSAVMKARNYRRRVALTRCPHDGAEFAVTWQLPRPKSDCRACGRRYALFGPQLYEHRQP